MDDSVDDMQMDADGKSWSRRAEASDEAGTGEQSRRPVRHRFSRVLTNIADLGGKVLGGIDRLHQAATSSMLAVASVASRAAEGRRFVRSVDGREKEGGGDSRPELQDKEDDEEEGAGTGSAAQKEAWVRPGRRGLVIDVGVSHAQLEVGLTPDTHST